MKILNGALDAVRDVVRQFASSIAKILDQLSNGKITPNSVTIFGLIMHLPIAWLITTDSYLLAAILLIIFGLFDTLDGALARLQNKTSDAGMLLDASTDRMKEVILYTGVAYTLISLDQAFWAVWAVAACGSSICVSYIKAKGETAIRDKKLSANQVNRLFQDGLGRFEIRMFLLVIGLVINQLGIVLIIITVLSTYTTFERLIKITRKLK